MRVHSWQPGCMAAFAGSTYALCVRGDVQLHVLMGTACRTNNPACNARVDASYAACLALPCPATVADGSGAALHPRRVARRSRAPCRRSEARVARPIAHALPDTRPVVRTRRATVAGRATRPRPCPGPSAPHPRPSRAGSGQKQDLTIRHAAAERLLAWAAGRGQMCLADDAVLMHMRALAGMPECAGAQEEGGRGQAGSMTHCLIPWAGEEGGW
mmetsp:Transcript_30081/g.89199  ORF Transcript_30081/g.89199 Transcript_30081/m.89199 type:complete len:215 (-) Transcript_30081:9-653(-)